MTAADLIDRWIDAGHPDAGPLADRMKRLLDTHESVLHNGLVYHKRPGVAWFGILRCPVPSNRIMSPDPEPNPR